MTEWYSFLKLVHLSAVSLSLGLFVLRANWMLVRPWRLQRRWIKIVPHLVDTLLLASAVGLMLILHQYPFVQSWLTAKVSALIIYIVLGSIGLKHGRTKLMRAVACSAAILVFGYIVAVALTRDPLGPIALL